MGKVRKRRAARRKLRAHDRGENRHAKGVMHLRRERRLGVERAGQKESARAARKRRERAEVEG